MRSQGNGFELLGRWVDAYEAGYGFGWTWYKWILMTRQRRGQRLPRGIR